MSDVSWAGIGAAIGAFLTGLFAWLVQRSKGSAERDVAVIAQWEKLTTALSGRVSAVEAELAKVRSNHAAEIEAIRKAHSAEIDEMRKTHRAEMKAMRDLNEGLQRMIAQDSQSTARLLGSTPVTGTLKRAFPPADEGEDGP